MVPRFLAEHAAAILAAGAQLSILRAWHALPLEEQQHDAQRRRVTGSPSAPRPVWISSPGADPDPSRGAAIADAGKGSVWAEGLHLEPHALAAGASDPIESASQDRCLPVFPAAARFHSVPTQLPMQPYCR